MTFLEDDPENAEFWDSLGGFTEARHLYTRPHPCMHPCIRPAYVFSCFFFLFLLSFLCFTRVMLLRFFFLVHSCFVSKCVPSK